jgi:hypothetical protein
MAATFDEMQSATRSPRSIVRTSVYADGRIIWDRRFHGFPEKAVRVPEGANELNSAYLEQRLSTPGAPRDRVARLAARDEGASCA